uniref:Phosphoenolpyruvate synthase alpha subunit n=1 Tax=uncultured bacterium psy1 TaxID=693111 RepID=D2SUE4_9BACT|nr:phosphoenolpyruvate synthase alpha subunit [uncultured bacterium psy1]
MLSESSAKLIEADDASSVQVSLVGGKGAELAHLRAAGLRVPPWFCLSSEACREFLSVHGWSTNALVQASEEARQTALVELAKASLSGTWVEPFRERVRAMLELSGAVVVRSSANVEDSAQAAFAGQFKTELGLTDVEAVCAAVIGCWLSLFADHAMRYAETMKRVNDLAMAVVVQQFVPADVAGVLFTMNPTTHDRDQAVVEAAWGLGEGLVSGLAVPDRFVVARDRRIVATEIGAKSRGLYWNPVQSKVEERANPRYFCRQAALSEVQVDTLVEMGYACEQRVGCPQDIEWAIRQDRIYVLQARPITA